MNSTKNIEGGEGERGSTFLGRALWGLQGKNYTRSTGGHSLTSITKKKTRDSNREVSLGQPHLETRSTRGKISVGEKRFPITEKCCGLIKKGVSVTG